MYTVCGYFADADPQTPPTSPNRSISPLVGHERRSRGRGRGASSRGRGHARGRGRGHSVSQGTAIRNSAGNQQPQTVDVPGTSTQAQSDWREVPLNSKPQKHSAYNFTGQRNPNRNNIGSPCDYFGIFSGK